MQYKWVVILEKNILRIYAVLLLLLGGVTLGLHYTQPPLTQWDEVYYIPPIARYEQGIFFMESHPPLGKLLLTLGDVIVQPNKQIDQSAVVRYDAVGSDTSETQDDLPVGYSFAGIRLISIVFGMAIPIVVLYLVYALTRKEWLGFFAGMLVVLDTALTVSFRAAMLDSILLFFMLMTVYFCVRSVQEYTTYKKLPLPFLLATTVFAGLSISIKYNAVVLLLGVFFVSYLRSCTVVSAPRWINGQKKFEKLHIFLYRFADVWTRFLVQVLLIAAIFISIFVVHFSIARKYDPSLKNNQGFFGASEVLQAELRKDSFINTPYKMLLAVGSGIGFTFNYHSSVPGYQICEDSARSKGGYCNGSLPWMWPFMARTVNYRWSQFAPHNTNSTSLSVQEYSQLSDEEKKNYTIKTSYYTLVPNPAVWILGLMGAIYGLWYIQRFLIDWAIHPIRLKSYTVFDRGVISIVSLYSAYLLIALISSRVLYLYHYFFGLVLSIILFALFYHKIEEKNPRMSQWILLGLFVLVVAGFVWFAPFAYGIPLSLTEFGLRNWFPWWILQSS